MIDIRYQYDGTAPDYDQITRLSGYDRVPPRLVAAFQQAAGLTPAMRVLDFGCGTGKLTQAICDTGAAVDITGLEPCLAMAEQFTKRFQGRRNITFKRGGYTDRLPLPDADFNAVLSSGVFDHIRITPDVMKEFMRVIKPRGYLAFTYERHSRLFPFAHMRWGGGAIYSHQDSHVQDCLEQAGAKILKHERLFGYFYFHLARMGLFVAQKPG
ncbi:MAG: class I SAM-dependent methyltransferase [Micavibrio aeruginosavorus]|uniref:Class I SAM-dependent methyltransferase n=1 Tax=Micavibrio aeruginosavorus TaxID=349221 RepID=A0A7T5R203_9BACT|nr:MAG: class I SAM-dependent methyltransferase [Micavibrio aeruginosavorus]